MKTPHGKSTAVADDAAKETARQIKASGETRNEFALKMFTSIKDNVSVRLLATYVIDTCTADEARSVCGLLGVHVQKNGSYVNWVGELHRYAAAQPKRAVQIADTIVYARAVNSARHGGSKPTRKAVRDLLITKGWSPAHTSDALAAEIVIEPSDNNHDGQCTDDGYSDDDLDGEGTGDDDE